jgi:polar amino acid transport system substrate-binding protein
VSKLTLLPGLALIAALAGCSASAEQATPSSAPVLITSGVLTVCTDMPYAPFESKRGGKPVGFDIDLVNAVALQLGLTTKIIDTDFDSIANGAALDSGKCDMEISAMTITGDRARVLDFSSPYFNASQAMVVASDSGIKSLDDLAGQKIGVQADTTGEVYVTDHAPDTADVVPFQDSGALDQAIAAGQVAAAVYDNTVVGQVVGANPGLHVAAEFDTGEQYGMAVKKNGNTPLLEAINSVVADLKAGKDYDKIYQRWFGDAKAE